MDTLQSHPQTLRVHNEQIEIIIPESAVMPSPRVDYAQQTTVVTTNVTSMEPPIEQQERMFYQETIVNMDESIKMENDKKGDSNKKDKKDKKKKDKKESESEDESGSEKGKNVDPHLIKLKKRKKLKKKAVKCFEKTVDFLDGFGESVDGPGLRKKTFIGAFATTVMRIVVVVLIAYKLYLLIIDQRTQTTGSILGLNYFRATDTKYMDIPTLQLNIRKNITFYERREYGPSLQRIDIYDNFGYEKVFSSRRKAEDSSVVVPITKSVNGKASIKLNSFSPALTPPFTSVQISRGANSSQSLFTTKQQSLNMLSSKVSDPLKILYLMNGVFDSGDSVFYNNTVHLYLRFVDDMSHIKPCQIQVGLLNNGILELISTVGGDGKTYIKKEYQSHSETQFVTQNATWLVPITSYEGSGTTSEISSEGINYNMIYLNSKFTTKDLNSFLAKKNIGGASIDVAKRYSEKNMTPASFLEWSFLISYVNNFIYTENTIQCDEYESDVTDLTTLYSKPSKNLKDWIFNVDIQIIADMVVGTSNFFYAQVPSTFSPDSNSFYLIVFGVTGMSEVVQITNVESPTTVLNGATKKYIKLSVMRTNPKDFKSVESQGSTFVSTVINYQTVNSPNSLPPNWISKGFWNCAASKYGDGFCDCECGFSNSTHTYRDVDCDDLLPTLFFGNNFVNNYMKTSCATSGQFCSSAGSCISAPYLKASKPCYTKASYLGEKQVVGFYGAQSDFQENLCSQCLGDTFYNQAPNLSYKNNKYMCQLTPKGYLFGRDVFSSVMQGVGYLDSYTDGPGFLETKCMNIPVRMYVGHPFFPSIAKGKYYELDVGDESNDQYVQTLYLVNVNSTKRTTKTLNTDNELVGESKFDIQIVCLGAEDFEEIQPIVGFGVIASSVSPYSNYIFVEPKSVTTSNPNITLSFIGQFPTSGSFKIQFYSGQTYSDGLYDSFTKQPIMLDVDGVTNLDDLQILQLRSPPSFSIGLAFELKSFNDDERTNVTIQQFAIGTDLSETNIIQMVANYKADPATYETRRPRMLIRPSVSDYSYTQYLKIDDVKVTNQLPLTYEIIFAQPISPDFSVSAFIECVNDMSVGTVLVPMALSPSYARSPYPPSKAYENVGVPTPDSFNIEYSMFVVPDKKNFPNFDIDDETEKVQNSLSDTVLNLCPRVYTYEKTSILYSDQVWSNFTLDPTRGYQIKNCSLQVWTNSMVNTHCVDASKATKNKYNDNCIKEMPPSQSLVYNHVVQLNNKWQNYSVTSASDASTGGATRPEYEYNFKHVYHFQHDHYAGETDSKFSGQAPTSGDSTQDGTNYFFNGKLNFIGKSFNPYVPANNPILDMEATIDLSEFFAKDILKNADELTANYVFNFIAESGTWRGIKSKTEKDVNNFGRSIFNSVKIKWDFSSLEQGSLNNKLTLTPGSQYNLYATLKVTSVYSSGVFGNADVTNIQVFVQSTSVTHSVLDYLNRNKCILNYIIQIDMAQSTQVILASNYTFLSFFSDVGAALGVMSLGAIIVELWQSYISQPEMFLHEAIKDEKKRRKNLKKAKGSVSPDFTIGENFNASNMINNIASLN